MLWTGGVLTAALHRHLHWPVFRGMHATPSPHRLVCCYFLSFRKDKIPTWAEKFAKDILINRDYLLSSPYRVRIDEQVQVHLPVSQSVLYYRNHVYDIRMITKADLPLIQDLLCYLISNRCTCYEDFSIYVMGLCMV